MYMEPIIAEKVPSTPATPVARRVAGVVVLLASLVVMTPWLAANAAFSAVALGVRGLMRLPRVLVQAIDYAGTVALGR